MESQSEGGFSWGLNDAYYRPEFSDVSSLSAGDTIYVQVDAFNNVSDNTTGNVLEMHETAGPVKAAPASGLPPR